MQTRNILDVRTVVVVASLIALGSLTVWSIGFGLSSNQSLQNQVDDLITQKNSLQTQVTGLQSQVTSLNVELAEKQTEIENLDVLVTAYRNLFERLHPELQMRLERAQIQ